jgi:hypothetical protein
MKKLFSIMVLMALVGTGLWAEEWPPSNYTGVVPRKLNLQESPLSVVNAATDGLFGSDIDDYIDVTDWSNVEYDKLFLFLGGAAANNGDNNSVAGNYQGGLATKLGSSHLGFYYSGNIFNGGGYNNGETGSAKHTEGTATWDNSLAVVFGNEGIGGIRFDMMFNNALFKDTNTGDGDSKTSESDNHLVTSLQWGKAFGDLIPKVTLGFQWPKYNNGETAAGKTEDWKNAQVGLKLDLKFRDFGGDYQATIDFGTTQKNTDNKKTTTTGFFHNDLNLHYTFTWNVDEKIAVKLKPMLNLQFGLADNKKTFDGNSDDGMPAGYFSISPGAAIGGMYAWKPTINLYGGVTVAILDFKTGWLTNTATDKTQSLWSVAGLTAVTPSLGIQIKPLEAFSIEAGLDSVVDVSNGSWHFDFSNIGGRLAFTFKPGARGSAQ